MGIHRHNFSDRFISAVQDSVETDALETVVASHLLSYLHDKMKAAGGNPKSRKSFGNIYAIFVVVEDYRSKIENPDDQLEVIDYTPARFGDLFTRQRELFGGAKLQNHALNERCNSEFVKVMRKKGLGAPAGPIIRDQATEDYWVNQEYLIVEVGDDIVNISAAVIGVVEEYIAILEEQFTGFIEYIEHVIAKDDQERAHDLILTNLGDDSDARLFEITSFSIMHCFLSQNSTYIGPNQEELSIVPWTLYKTGRTNANDGGIDFVLQPHGRFYQVTEDTNVTKWFLDIDKVARYPITFVVKDSRTPEDILQAMREGAFGRDELSDEDVDNMMECIHEIVNVPNLIEMFNHCTENGLLECIMDQILEQSRVEFNIEE
jgi:hypothetical protein